MAGFLRGGGMPHRSGGNREREAFANRAHESASRMRDGGHESKAGGMPEHSSPVIGTSTVHHHEDGSHSVEHHDGETTHHPSGGHMGVHMAAKHDGGEHGHIHAHERGATTHHVGMDGEVSGPHEHESVQEGGNHLMDMMGDGPENETSSVMGHQEPDGDEGAGY